MDTVGYHRGVDMYTVTPHGREGVVGVLFAGGR